MDRQAPQHLPVRPPQDVRRDAAAHMIREILFTDAGRAPMWPVLGACCKPFRQAVAGGAAAR